MWQSNVTPRWLKSSACVLMLTLLLTGCANPWLLLKPLPKEALTLPKPSDDSLRPKGEVLQTVDSNIDSWANALKDLPRKTESSEPSSSN